MMMKENTRFKKVCLLVLHLLHKKKRVCILTDLGGIWRKKSVFVGCEFRFSRD